MSKKNPFAPLPSFKEVDLQKSKGILDDYAVRKDVQSRSGKFTTLNVTQTFSINGTDIFARDNSWTGDNTFEVSAGQFTISNQQDADAFFYFNSSAGGTAWYGVNSEGFVEMGGLDVHILNDLEVTGYSYQNKSISTPSRALNTTYQNTTGHTIRVQGSISCLWSDNNSADVASFVCLTDSASTPTTEVDSGGVPTSQFIITANAAFIGYFHFDFEVANNHYYRITTTTAGAGTTTLRTWRESNA